MTTTGTSYSFFTESQAELMRRVLDRIIPAEGQMPAAGEVGVTGYIDRVVGSSQELKRLFHKGLAQVQVSAQTALGAAFESLSSERQDEVLREVEAQEAAFFNALVRQAYNGYYTNSRVITALGLEARPPQPRGYRLEAGNLALIEGVKKRGIAYRVVK